MYSKVVEYCREHNLSLHKFEMLCGIGNGTIDDWEHGSKPSMGSLEKIAAYTNIPIARWLED